MAASDMLCLPSYREGFGLVLIEAAATGIPTIGSRIYGISDAVVEAETGLLFKPGDVDELAEKIAVLIEEPLQRRVLGERGKERAKRDFSRELVLAEFSKYYRSVLSR
jgi:glycosyltransferase involved in cell wall biosynthesis